MRQNEKNNVLNRLDIRNLKWPYFARAKIPLSNFGAVQNSSRSHFFERATMPDPESTSSAAVSPRLTDSGPFSTVENALSIVMLGAADDQDTVGNGLTFQIVGGVDAASFALDGATGGLRFFTAPDFEKPGDNNHDNVYDLMVRVRDSQGLYSDTALSVRVTDQPNLQLVFTSGQSLSVGASHNHYTLSSTPPYPNEVLGLNFGSTIPPSFGWGGKAVNPSTFSGFKPLAETITESHVSGMMNMLEFQYQSHGLTAPTFVHINTGAGGRSVLQLMTSKSDIFASFAEGLQHKTSGEIFAVDLQNGTYDFYVRTDTGALFYNNDAGAPVFYDNLVTQMQLAANYGRAQGYELDDNLLLNWIQGQSDTYLNSTAAGRAGYGYEYVLGRMFDQVEAAAKGIVGTNADVFGVVSQVRGFGDKSVAIDQLDYVLSNPNVTLGATEFQFEAEFPSWVTQDYTHLSPEGYYMMGQTIGSRMFDLVNGQENAPIVMDAVTRVSPTSVIVHFSGVDTYLVNDPSPYRAENFISPPPNMGFSLANSSGGGTVGGLAISNVAIVGPDTVQIDFNKALTIPIRIYLGASKASLGTYANGALSGFGGTTLRDASVTAAMLAPNGYALSDPYIYEYAPVQYFSISVNTAPVVTSSMTVNAAENGTFAVDLAVMDDSDAEGSGISYSITGGTDAARFLIDATTGVLVFSAAPDFENPADSNQDNIYVVNIAVSDAIGAITNIVQTIMVTNINEAPTSIADPGFTVATNAAVGTVVGTATGNDPDAGDMLTYALVDTLSGTFVIDPVTGVISIASSAALAGYQGQIVALPVTATDTMGLSVQGVIHVTVSAQPALVGDFVGTSGDDLLTGSSGGESFTGLAGNDKISGQGGNDILNGGAGNDLLDGGTGNDTVSYVDATSAVALSLAVTKAQNTGGAGSDTLIAIENIEGSAFADKLTGNAGVNTLTGNAGNDLLDGGAGGDVLVGGTENDTYMVDNVADQVIENAGEGTDTVKSSVTYGLSANVDKLVLTGTANIDATGNDLANTLTGNAGDNLLLGGLGKDFLSGGAGNDTLNGGQSADKLTGGLGLDTFLLDIFESSVNKDTITDFTVGEDHIALTRSAFAAFAGDPTGVLDPTAFAIGTTATTAGQHLVYNQITGILYYDADGLGGAAQIQIAQLAGLPNLSASDFILI